MKAVGGLAAEIFQIPAGIQPKGESIVSAAPTEEAALKADNLN
jgi:hypothetical protein